MNQLNHQKIKLIIKKALVRQLISYAILRSDLPLGKLPQTITQLQIRILNTWRVRLTTSAPVFDLFISDHQPIKEQNFDDFDKCYGGLWYGGIREKRDRLNKAFYIYYNTIYYNIYIYIETQKEHIRSNVSAKAFISNH